MTGPQQQHDDPFGEARAQLVQGLSVLATVSEAVARWYAVGLQRRAEDQAKADRAAQVSQAPRVGGDLTWTRSRAVGAHRPGRGRTVRLSPRRGYAVQAAGFLQRPSEDIDLFTVWERRGEFDTAAAAVVEAYVAAGFSVEIERRHDTFTRLTVSAGEHTAKVELGVDLRANEPVRISIGPVLHPDDAITNKMGALYERALARDFIDVDAALQSGRYTEEDLLRLAEPAAITFDRELFAQAIGQAQLLDADDFAQYGVAGADLDRLRQRFAAWHTQLRAGS